MLPRLRHLHLSRREFIKTLLFPTGVVLFSFLAVTLWAYYGAAVYLKDAISRTTVRRISTTEDAITARMDTYAESLRGATGLFYASNSVTHADWTQFANNLDIANRFPGVTGIGFAKVVSAAEISDLEAKAREEGMPAYAIQRDATKTHYTPILYLEPSTTSNEQALGFDLAANPVRSTTMKRAMESGLPTLSEQISLNDENPESPPSFLLFMPLYKKGMPVVTAEQRTAAIDGYVFMPFTAAEVISSMLPEDSLAEVGVDIYARDHQNNQQLYQNELFRQLNNRPHYEAQQSIHFDGTTWLIDYRLASSIVPDTVRQRPSTTLGWGIILSLLIALVVLRLLANRANKLVDANEEAVQLAKDDLLSLASHQLRTPATGVKQYLGMLIEGYAGKLNASQRNFLTKAYQSNERQLHIINELLFVAKADEGRIVLSRQTTNLNKLVREIVGEQTSSFKERKQKVTVKVPRKIIHINADAHSLRMALDNLLSNASKYSHSGGTITVAATETPKEVLVSIEDNGVGINKHDMHMLFKQFSRIPNELSAHTSGSGIGLYLAHHLIQLHDGTINVRSTPGNGSTFTVRLPKQNHHKRHKKYDKLV